MALSTLAFTHSSYWGKCCIRSSQFIIYIGSRESDEEGWASKLVNHGFNLLQLTKP